MKLKDLLVPIATKYNVTITYPDLHIEEYEPQKQVAEITGFQGEDKFKQKFQKVEIRMEIEAELDKLGIAYTMVSSFNPDKLTLTIKEAK